MLKTKNNNAGVYTNFNSLLLLRYKVSCLSNFKLKLRYQSLAGQRRSMQRGRGLDFKELRQYQFGDDIRQFDWKVTHRTKKPHVRVYADEKEQGITLVVDQRKSMFFGSTRKMKSVIAAEMTALLAWGAFRKGDRVAALLLGGRQCINIKSQCSQDNIVNLLKQLCHLNQQLGAGVRNETKGLNQELKKLLENSASNRQVWIISDIAGCNSIADSVLEKLAKRNELKIVMVYDALEKEIPSSAELPISDGNRCIVIDANNELLQKKYQIRFEQALEEAFSRFNRHGVSAVLLNTDRSIESQLNASTKST